jgi:hypothetical protein
MEVYSTSAGFADEWLFAEPSGTLTSVRAGSGLTAAPSTSRVASTNRSRVPMSGYPRLALRTAMGSLPAGDLPLQIGRETRRNTNLDNSLANVSVRLDVFAHLQ